MSDLVERLRDASQHINSLANESGWTIADEAAKEIEGLIFENERLQNALKLIEHRVTAAIRTAIVPQVAEVISRAINEIEAQETVTNE